MSTPHEWAFETAVTILMVGLGIATMGYVMAGSWMAYALVTR